LGGTSLVEKVDVDLNMAYRLLHPRNTILVTCVNKEGRKG